MTAIEKTLNMNEKVEISFKTSAVPLCISLVFFVGFILTMIISVIIKVWILVAFVAMLSFALMLYVIDKLEYYCTTRISITNKRVIMCTGLLKTTLVDLPREKVSAVKIQQGIIGKCADYSNVDIETSANTSAIKVKNLKEPFALKKSLEIENDN